MRRLALRAALLAAIGCIAALPPNAAFADQASDMLKSMSDYMAKSAREKGQTF